jgi:hypothetical protein
MFLCISVRLIWFCLLCSLRNVPAHFVRHTVGVSHCRNTSFECGGFRVEFVICVGFFVLWNLTLTSISFGCPQRLNVNDSKVDNLNIMVFWAVTLCFWYHCSEQACCFHIQAWVHKSRHQVFPECWYLDTKIDGSASQKTAILIFADLRTCGSRSLVGHTSCGKLSFISCILWHWYDEATLRLLHHVAWKVPYYAVFSLLV